MLGVANKLITCDKEGSKQRFNYCRVNSTAELTFNRAVSSLSHIKVDMKWSANEVLFALNPY